MLLRRFWKALAIIALMALILAAVGAAVYHFWLRDWLEGLWHTFPGGRNVLF